MYFPCPGRPYKDLGLAVEECILAKPAHLGTSPFTSMKPKLTSTLTWLTTTKVPSHLSFQKKFRFGT
ncbi:hypothetical protein IGI04_042383 [Brassica rapa subsp. trilocularis]|uniref:Uncharacterized protein n=1 Tax=Brassica rapa subsp. trilocularis TaxID=1813537 RepID=A0ABQ7KM44_BRACM|nr:hypothetical protein IGI04_042383 [Brassica rapa subsp. trilocularis]